MLKAVPEFLVSHYVNVLCFSLLLNSVITLFLWGSLLNGLGTAIVVFITDYMWWKQYGNYGE